MAKVSLSMNRAWFRCPGCKEPHAYTIKPTPNKPDAPCWEFNGDVDNPTFKPSLLMTTPHADGDRRCHMFVRDGEIEFLSDCTHELAGKKVPMQEIKVEDF